MARQELIVEYEKDLIRELEDTGKLLGRSPHIIVEIRKLLGYPKDTPVEITHTKTKKEPVKAEGIPKGGSNWESYVQLILKELGGIGRTNEVRDYAVRANPKIDPDLILSAVRGKLSKLKINGVIGANESSNKKEGYEFYIIKNDKKEGVAGNINLLDLLVKK